MAHPTDETIIGRPALARYLEKEAAQQGAVRVRMGLPVIDGDRVAAEFWVTCNDGPGATIAGCLIASLEPDGRCSRFCEYWFDIEGTTPSYAGWGE